MSDDGCPTLVLREPRDDPDLAILQELQFLVLRYPVVAQAACRALIAEGRRFGATPEGAAWRARLERSELVRRGRVLWEASALDVLDERGDEPLPSVLLDALVGILSSDDFSRLLGRLLQGG